MSWRKLHIEDFHNLYSSQNIIRVVKSKTVTWAGHEFRMGDTRNASRDFMVKPQGKRPPGRPRRRREDSIKIDV
jgi:hypothetical protein